MQLGEPVQGVFTDYWRFVEADMHDIASRVIEYDKDARLACHVDGHLGIVRYVQAEFCPGGAWIVAFNLTDVASEDGRWYGEPDERVIHQMSRGDMQKKDPRKFAKNVQRLMMLHEAQTLAAAKEKLMGDPDKFIHRYRRMEGQKRKIFVP